MSEKFNIDNEIDVIFDKFTEQMKSRLKKLVEKSNKTVLKQYIASQKETGRIVKDSNIIDTSRKVKKELEHNTVPKKSQNKRTGPRKESEYRSSSSESDSDSD